MFYHIFTVSLDSPLGKYSTTMKIMLLAVTGSLPLLQFQVVMTSVLESRSN